MSARTVQTTLDGGILYNARCKYCGKPFVKYHNKVCYCSDECRGNALREQKAEYARRRRSSIQKGELVADEKTRYGLGSFGTTKRAHRLDDFDDEYRSIQKEKRRLKI